MGSMKLHVNIEGSFLKAQKSETVERKEAEILRELKALGENVQMEKVFKFLIYKIAVLEAEVFKANSIKFITED